jgi:probable phosphomutase (TIGR03848 family)
VARVPICLLVRHGRTTANASGTLAGWTTGVGLDDAGRGQAEALGKRLSSLPVAVIVSSPLQRCQETSVILADALGPLEVETVHDLGECRYGAWTGGALKDLAQDPLWRVVQDHPSAARFPDGEEFAGESIAEMQLRAVRAIRATDAAVARDHGPDALWVAVSHGDVIKSVISDAAGAHLDQFQRIMVDPASLSVVRYTERRPFVVRVNDAGIDLAGLVPPPPKPPAADEAVADETAGDAERGEATVGQAEGAAAGADTVPAIDTSGDAPVGGGAGTAD